MVKTHSVCHFTNWKKQEPVSLIVHNWNVWLSLLKDRGPREGFLTALI